MSRDDTKRILRLHTALESVMTDKRFDDGRRMGSDLRNFVVAYLWAAFENPTDSDARYQRTKELAGIISDRPGIKLDGYRLRSLYAADAPRYEPRSLYEHALCPVPMQRGPRTGEPCGKRGSMSFRVTDSVTGEWEIQGWCRNHQAFANAARAAEMSTPKPEPLPNTGGLLPGYIRAKNWPDLYVAAKPSWKPPSIGIDANDWPVLAKVAEKAVIPQFEVLAGGSEDSDLPAPILQLVSS